MLKFKEAQAEEESTTLHVNIEDIDWRLIHYKPCLGFRRLKLLWFDMETARFLVHKTTAEDNSQMLERHYLLHRPRHDHQFRWAELHLSAPLETSYLYSVCPHEKEITLITCHEICYYTKEISLIPQKLYIIPFGNNPPPLSFTNLALYSPHYHVRACKRCSSVRRELEG